MAWKILTTFAAIFLAVAGVFRYLNYVDANTEEMLVTGAEKNHGMMVDRDQEMKDEDKTTDDLLAAAGDAETIYNDDTLVLEDPVSGKIKVAQDKVDNVNTIISGLEADLQKLRDTEARIGELSVVVENMKRLASESATLENEIKAIEQKNLEITAEIRQEEAIIADLRDLEGRQILRKMEESFRGKVSQIHSTWGFVVIDAGNDEQVYTGAKLDVMRGDEAVGQLRISFVSPTEAICDVLKDTFEDGVNVRIGDVVKPSKEEEKPAAPPAGPLPENPGPAAPINPPAPDPNDPFGAPAPPANPTTPNPFGEGGGTTTPNPFGGGGGTTTPNPFGS